LSHKRAYDLLVQAESGARAVTGHPAMPAKPGPPVADISAGLYAALSVMAVLIGWARHGGADAAAPSVAVSLFDTMTVIMGYQLTHARFRYVRPRAVPGWREVREPAVVRPG
jgi:itaconate CoA-transferase